MNISDQIRKILQEDDLMGLIRLGAPEDEYDSELESLMAAITYNSTVDFIHQVLWNVFYNYFCVYTSYFKFDHQSNSFKEFSKEQSYTIEDAPKMIGEFEKYKKTAEKIHNILKLSHP